MGRKSIKENKTEILRQYFINHPQSIDKYTFLQNSAFTQWVKEKCSKMCWIISFYESIYGTIIVTKAEKGV